jgi:hypothetical protein
MITNTTKLTIGGLEGWLQQGPHHQGHHGQINDVAAIENVLEVAQKGAGLLSLAHDIVLGQAGP